MEELYTYVMYLYLQNWCHSVHQPASCLGS